MDRGEKDEMVLEARLKKWVVVKPTGDFNSGKATGPVGHGGWEEMYTVETLRRGFTVFVLSHGRHIGEYRIH